MGKTERENCRLCVKEGEVARIGARVEAIERRTEEIYEAQMHTVDRLDELIPAVARLEVKAGIWGGVGGLLAALVIAGVALVSKL